MGILFSKHIHTYLHLLHPSHRETYNTSEFEAEGLKIWYGQFWGFHRRVHKTQNCGPKFPHAEAEAKHKQKKILGAE